MDHDAAARVVWLLNNLWGGNRSRMAEALGCTQSVISKIATGMQGPGRRLLQAIMSHPKVNPHWVLTGNGTPLLASPDALPNPVIELHIHIHIAIPRGAK